METCITMKLKKVIGFIAMILSMALLSVACGQNENRYDLPNVAVGDMFEITLQNYADGGYSWDYNLNPSSGIEYVKVEYIEPDDPEICGGVRPVIYTFKANKIGSFEIKFHCHRAWTSESIETNIYKITVT